MLGWLVDNTVLLTFVLGAIAVGGFAMYWSNRRGRYAGVGLGAVVLIALLWLLGRVVVSDQQKILNNLEAMRNGVETGDFDEVFRHVSNKFLTDGVPREEYAKRLKGIMRGKKFGIHIWEQQVERKNETTADCYFNFRVDLDGSPVMMKSAKGEFVKEGGDWKLSGFEAYRIGTREIERIPGVN
jgi:hypothetical protein